MVRGLEWVRIGVVVVVGTEDRAHFERQWIRPTARCRRWHGIVSRFWILHVGLRVGVGERRSGYPSSTPVEEEVRKGNLRPNSAPQEGEARKGYGMGLDRRGPHAPSPLGPGPPPTKRSQPP